MNFRLNCLSKYLEVLVWFLFVFIENLGYDQKIVSDFLCMDQLMISILIAGVTKYIFIMKCVYISMSYSDLYLYIQFVISVIKGYVWVYCIYIDSLYMYGWFVYVLVMQVFVFVYKLLI